VRAVVLCECKAVINKVEPVDNGKLFNFGGTNPPW